MKGLILSGGKGTRLRPITYTGAKQLVPVANKPVLFYAIEALVEGGVTDIGIITGDTHDEVVAAVGDGSRFGARITYIPQSAPLGLAHAVQTAQPFLGGDDFIMYLGDNLIKEGVVGLIKTFQAERPNALILLAEVPNPEQFGCAQLDPQGRVVKLVEKPKIPPSNLALVGVYLFDKQIHHQINALKPSARGEYEITDAIQGLIDDGYQVRSHLVTGWWKDTGKKSDMLEANRIMLEGLTPRIEGQVDGDSNIEGRVVIDEAARIVNSTIRGPAIIGRGVLIENAYIGPFTAIHHGVTIRNSEIEHSIVLENSQILDVGTRLESSLIGKNVQVKRSDTRPRAYKLMLGDSSQIELS